MTGASATVSPRGLLALQADPIALASRSRTERDRNHRHAADGADRRALVVRVRRTRRQFFNSTMITQSSESPTFSRECGGIGSDHNTAEGVGAPVARVSWLTFPSPSRRTKSAELTMYWTFGQRWVWTAVVSSAPITVSSTRTHSFSNTRRWCSGAAISASSSSGHVHCSTASTLEDGRPTLPDG